MTQIANKLAGKVVVVTGASSGLGLATALELARHGAVVVAAARRGDLLEDVSRRCREVGGQALPIVADVTRDADVHRLAEQAAELTGVVDAWINNAGVTAFGPLESTPIEQHRQVLETNLWGAIHGARAILPRFRRQGYGVLVNVGSVLSRVGQPFVPSYVISKFALRGLSEALRAELADQPRIHVCTLLPYAIDTPHFEEGANWVGRKPHAMPPVQSPEKVARALVELIQHPVRERLVPRSAAIGLALHALFPRTVERLIHDVLSHWHFGPSEPVKAQGNLWQPANHAVVVHGTRPPRIGLARLAAWIARRYLSAGPALPPPAR